MALHTTDAPKMDIQTILQEVNDIRNSMAGITMLSSVSDFPENFYDASHL